MEGAAKKKGSGGVKVVEDSPKPEEKPKAEEKPKNFIVIPADAVGVVQCPDEKSAARAIAADNGYAGKLLVVEADYLELFTASHRVEVKPESMDKFVQEAMRQNGDGEGEGEEG